MLKRTIVIPMLVFVCVVVALIFTNINGYLINQLATIDKFPVVYQFLDGRSDLEKTGLMAVTIVILGLIAAVLSWMVTKFPEWFSPTTKPIAGLESGRRVQLIKQQTKEVDDRLKDALERSEMIPLAFEDASPHVEKLPLEDLQRMLPIGVPAKGFLAQARRLLSFGKGVEAELPPQMKMIEVFRRRDVSGRLLILGHPGAGKTTTLLELAQELLGEAQAAGATRIPHVFEMSRWEEGLSIVEYLASELKQVHNLDVAVGRGMAQAGELLPLLDGLDELREPRVISAAMGAINTYLAESADRDAVVCCRVLDYGLASEQLRELNGAIELQPLSELAIRSYLTGVGKGHLWALTEQNPALLRDDRLGTLPLLKTPLFLSVFAAVSPTVAVKSEGELWDAYIVKKLGIPAAELSGKGYKRYKGTEEPTQKQTKNYLIFLAQQLRRTTEVLLIEEMQPTWLRSEPKVLGRSVQQWQYGLILGLSIGLILGLILGLIGSLVLGLIGGLIFGLTWGLNLGLIGSLIFSLDPIESVEKLQILISRSALRKISKNLTGGLILSLMPLLMPFLIPTMIIFLSPLLIMSLSPSLIENFKTDLKVRLEPNQGIKASVKNMLILMLINVFLWGLVLIKLMPYLQGFLTPAEVQLFPGVIAVSIVSIIYMIVFMGGGGAFFQHVSLRITLYLSHQKPNDTQSRCIPWNYARFLSYAADRKLLQQTGGAYRFIHRSLLEHFAGMEN